MTLVTFTPPSGMAASCSVVAKFGSLVWPSVTSRRRYGPPCTVWVLSVLARFSATTSMRVRCAARPEALTPRARKMFTVLHPTGDRLLQRGEVGGQDLRERLVVELVLGHHGHLPLHLHVVAVRAGRLLP